MRISTKYASLDVSTRVDVGSEASPGNLSHT